jgi:hypothetical protein
MLESGQERERIEGNDNLKETIPRSKNQIMWNTSAIWVA